MGGAPVPPPVPDWKMYTVGEHTPALQHLEQRLAAKGLKDPWIRNEVWRNDVRVFGTPGYRARALLLRAVVPGIAIGAALAAYSYYYKDLRAPRVPYQGDIKRE